MLMCAVSVRGCRTKGTLLHSALCCAPVQLWPDWATGQGIGSHGRCSPRFLRILFYAGKTSAVRPYKVRNNGRSGTQASDATTSVKATQILYQRKHPKFSASIIQNHNFTSPRIHHLHVDTNRNQMQNHTFTTPVGHTNTRKKKEPNSQVIGFDFCWYKPIDGGCERLQTEGCARTFHSTSLYIACNLIQLSYKKTRKKLLWSVYCEKLL